MGLNRKQIQAATKLCEKHPQGKVSLTQQSGMYAIFRAAPRKTAIYDNCYLIDRDGNIEGYRP